MEQIEIRHNAKSNTNSDSNIESEMRNSETVIPIEIPQSENNQLPDESVSKLKSKSKVTLSPEKYYESLISESPYIYGDHGIPPGETMEKLDWVDFSLIEEGKKFVKSHFFSIMFAHFISLIMIFTFKPGRSILLSSGESHSKANSLVRYLSTVMHIKLWYESDIIEKTARGSQDVYAVRKMHAAAAKNYIEMERQKQKSNTDDIKIGIDIQELSEDKRQLLDAVRQDTHCIDDSKAPAEILTDKPLVPMSQFDMVITQFCFIGFIVLLPQKFGIFNTRGINGFVHLWAILGTTLGIEDRFNLALHYDQQRRLVAIKNRENSETQQKPVTEREIKCSDLDLEAFRKIFYNIFLPNLKHTDETAMIMWDSLVYGSQHYTAFLRLKSVIYYLIVHVALLGKAENVRAVFSCWDKFCHRILILGVTVWARNQIILSFMNQTLRLSLWVCQKRYLPQWTSNCNSNRNRNMNSSCPHTTISATNQHCILEESKNRLNFIKTIKIKHQPVITQHVIDC